MSRSGCRSSQQNMQEAASALSSGSSAAKFRAAEPSRMRTFIPAASLSRASGSVKHS